MAATLFRVVNQQRLNRSILLDKIDRSQSNFSGYAQVAKQKVYVPYVNPLDTSVKGYTDLIPTDEVLLNVIGHGSIKRLSDEGYVSFVAFNVALTKAPIITSSVDAFGILTINGTTFLSLAPDVTYVTVTSPGGSTQTIPQSAFATHTGIAITIANATITIGVPIPGWKVQIKANSKLSNQLTL